MYITAVIAITEKNLINEVFYLEPKHAQKNHKNLS